MHRSTLESQRRALEDNLRMNDLSLNFESSVEYPRHADVQHNSIQHWFEDGADEGVHPYAGETLSTAAHHASALSLGAGLHGHHRRDTSYATSASGQEYDPDRPVSLLSMDPVFDKSNELDRLLQSGHQQRSVRMRSPLHSFASSSSDTESNRSFNAGTRPKISDALRNNSTFSPKRPKNPTKSSPALRSRAMADEDNIPTPKPPRRQHSAPAASFGIAKPDLHVQPPTPSSRASRSARDPHQQRQQHQQKLPTPSPLRRGALKSNTSSRVYLPDVTGLTSAVESPARGNLKHALYVHGRPRESEARLLAIIGSVQTQLNELEKENGVSRRRVRELEAELEDCKREVRRERARVDDLGIEAERLRKGKARAREDDADVSIRYREVVEEKKALENLLTTLHSHLARLTKELQNHQRFLVELRQLRETDALTLQQRGEDVQQLRDEVGRLKGEVEVLREVVEDGLRERRQKVRAKDEMTQEEDADTAMTIDESEEEYEEAEPFDPQMIPGSSRPFKHRGDGDDQEHEANSTFIHPRKGDRSMRTDYATVGRASSFGRSAVGTSTPVYGDESQGESFVDAEELKRIGREVEERRSLRVHQDDEISMDLEDSPSVVAAARRKDRRVHSHAQPPRPSAPTPNHAAATGPSRPPSTPPFPQIRGEHMERLFFSAPAHDARTCKVCHRHRLGTDDDDEDVDDGGVKTKIPSRREVEMRKAARDAMPTPEAVNPDEDEDDGRWDKRWRKEAKKMGVPPQTIVARVIGEQEDDFTHYKSIYVELADAYKVLDAASDVPRRNLLARHLKEVVDVLESKGDQIASLYDLLTFKDKPAAGLS